MNEFFHIGIVQSIVRLLVNSWGYFAKQRTSKQKPSGWLFYIVEKDWWWRSDIRLKSKFPFFSMYPLHYRLLKYPEILFNNSTMMEFFTFPDNSGVTIRKTRGGKIPISFIGVNQSLKTDILTAEIYSEEEPDVRWNVSTIVKLVFCKKEMFTLEELSGYIFFYEKIPCLQNPKLEVMFDDLETYVYSQKDFLVGR